jgi:hypothetical protein
VLLVAQLEHGRGFFEFDGADGGHGEADEGEDFCGRGADGSVECDSLGDVSPGSRIMWNWRTHLLLADSAVLIPPVTQHVLVRARVSSQAGFAGLVEQVEDDQSCYPEDDTKTPSNDAIRVS